MYIYFVHAYMAVYRCRRETNRKSMLPLTHYTHTPIYYASIHIYQVMFGRNFAYAHRHTQIE